MASHTCQTKTNAKKMAKRLRKKGLNVSIYKIKGGKWGVSATR